MVWQHVNGGLTWAISACAQSFRVFFRFVLQSGYKAQHPRSASFPQYNTSPTACFNLLVKKYVRHLWPRYTPSKSKHAEYTWNKQRKRRLATCPNLLLNWNETGKKFPNTLGKKIQITVHTYINVLQCWWIFSPGEGWCLKSPSGVVELGEVDATR